MGILTTDKRQWWLRTATTPSAVFTRVKRNTAFDPKVNRKTIETNHKDRINQSIYAISKTTTITFDIDLEEVADELQTYLEANEDVMNVATEVVCVLMNKPATAPAVGYMAKKAAFVMNQDPHDGDAADRQRARGELTMTDVAWTAGTFDPATATFTPEA